jgi:hypothetical protein
MVDELRKEGTNPLTIADDLESLVLMQDEMLEYTDEKIAIQYSNAILKKRDAVLKATSTKLTDDFTKTLRASDFSGKNLFEFKEQDIEKDKEKKKDDMIDRVLVSFAKAKNFGDKQRSEGVRDRRRNVKNRKFKRNGQYKGGKWWNNGQKGGYKGGRQQDYQNQRYNQSRNYSEDKENKQDSRKSNDSNDTTYNKRGKGGGSGGQYKKSSRSKQYS